MTKVYVSKRTTYWVLADEATQVIVTAGGADAINVYRTHHAAEIALQKISGLMPGLVIKRATLYIVR